MTAGCSGCLAALCFTEASRKVWICKLITYPLEPFASFTACLVALRLSLSLTVLTF